jgi:hypothetical protein
METERGVWALGANRSEFEKKFPPDKRETRLVSTQTSG